MDLGRGCGTIGGMVRWLAIAALGLALWTSPARAQVFKPRTATKSKPADTKSDKKTEKKSAEKKSTKHEAEARSTKPSSKHASHATRHTSKKSSRVAREGRPDDLTPDPDGKSDPDFVLITDDDDDE
jgi:FtsZ-interacting cell division protein ZipA